MHSIWIEDKQVQRALQRNEAFWNNTLEQGPLMWVTVPDAKPCAPPPEPATDDELWTDVEYVIEAAEYSLSHSQYLGDALPIHNPWLGPDQVAAWLGSVMTLRPRDFTSWIKPFVIDWSEYPRLAIDPDNHWGKTSGSPPIRTCTRGSTGSAPFAVPRTCWSIFWRIPNRFPEPCGI